MVLDGFIRNMMNIINIDRPVVSISGRSIRVAM